MQYEKYKIMIVHDTIVDDQSIKRDDPMVYIYTSMKPLNAEELQIMIEYAMNSIKEKMGVNND